MDQYKDYLSEVVLADQNIVTYRVLSRHLKIHVQIAKQMLYDFYRTETAKKPKSLHATYLLTGFRHASKPKPTAAKSKTLEVSQDEDTIMASSPFDHSSMAQQGPEQEAPLLRSVIIVPEEKLEETQKSFHRLTSIHIYSVEPAPLTDLTLISASNHEIWTTHIVSEPSEVAQFGTITNPVAKRKSNSIVPPSEPPALPSLRVETKKRPASAAANSFFQKKDEKKTPLSTDQKAKKEEPEMEEVKEEKPKSEPLKASSGKAGKPTAKPGSQKDFFAKFNAGAKKQEEKAAAKAKEQPPKLESDSEDGADDEPIVPTRDVAEDARKRAEQQAALEAMMDDDDEDEYSQPSKPSPPASAPPSEPPSAQPSRSETPVSQEVSRPPSRSASTNDSQPAEPDSAPRRRRGKRKVTKKVHVKDEEGYLVTRNEQVWESYSEEESAPPPKKQIKTVAPKKEDPADKGKKAPVKKGTGGKQGNIMSFFKKQP